MSQQLSNLLREVEELEPAISEYRTRLSSLSSPGLRMLAHQLFAFEEADKALRLLALALVKHPRIPLLPSSCSNYADERVRYWLIPHRVRTDVHSGCFIEARVNACDSGFLLSALWTEEGAVNAWFVSHHLAKMRSPTFPHFLRTYGGFWGGLAFPSWEEHWSWCLSPCRSLILISEDVGRETLHRRLGKPLKKYVRILIFQAIAALYMGHVGHGLCHRSFLPNNIHIRRCPYGLDLVYVIGKTTWTMRTRYIAVIGGLQNASIVVDDVRQGTADRTCAEEIAGFARACGLYDSVLVDPTKTAEEKVLAFAEILWSEGSIQRRSDVIPLDKECPSTDRLLFPRTVPPRTAFEFYERDLTVHAEDRLSLWDAVDVCRLVEETYIQYRSLQEQVVRLVLAAPRYVYPEIHPRHFVRDMVWQEHTTNFMRHIVYICALYRDLATLYRTIEHMGSAIEWDRLSVAKKENDLALSLYQVMTASTVALYNVWTFVRVLGLENTWTREIAFFFRFL